MVKYRRRKKGYIAGTHLRRCDQTGLIGYRSDMIIDKDTKARVLKEFHVPENQNSYVKVRSLERPHRFD